MIQKAALQSIPAGKSNIQMQVQVCKDVLAPVPHCMESPVSPEHISQPTAAPLKGTKCCAYVSLLFLSKSCLAHTWDTDKKICTVLSSVSDLDIFITISIRRFWWLCYEMISFVASLKFMHFITPDFYAFCSSFVTKRTITVEYTDTN